MRKITFTLLVLAVIAVGLLHFFTPGHLIFYHDTYRRLSYFPIVLGAIWFGLKGGLLMASLSSLAFIPHLLLYLNREAEYYLSELTEVVLYMAAGIVIGIIADKQAKLRDQYRRLSEKLEKSYSRLHEETALLIEVEEQLAASQKLSALGQLSASLAHEIKNPLSSIKGTAEILLDEFPEGHQKREFTEILLKEVNRLDSTVEEVLRYSGRRQSVKEASEPLSQVMNRVLKLLDNNLKKKSINLTRMGDAFPEDFYVDGGKMTQVFLNIILNAIDAATTRGKIAMEVKNASGGVSIAISDDGPGIKYEDREKVFEPFFSSKEGGTGLGLPISRKIVTSYGGRIDISEASGGGACFTVFLPFHVDGSLPGTLDQERPQQVKKQLGP
jgi:signal transduction histidine kinase